MVTDKKSPVTSGAKDRIRSFIPSDLFVMFVACSSVFAYFYFLQFSTDSLADRDSYFHIKFSQLMRERHGILYKLPWLQYTIYKDYFRDHHFLQHVLYIPFTFGNLLTGAKYAAFVFASLAGIVFYVVLRLCKIKYALFWMLAFLSSAPSFLYRISMLRVQSMSLALLLLSVYLIIRKRYKSLAVLAFSFVWLYDGFSLLIVITFIFFFCEYFIEKKMDFKLLIYVFSGLFAGIIINPFFPLNIESYFFNLVNILSGDTHVRKEQEWYPYTTYFLLEEAALVFILFFGAIGLTLGRLKKKDYVLTSTFILSLFFMALLFKSRRFIEYWPPFALLFSAFAVHHVFCDNNNGNNFLKKWNVWNYVLCFMAASLIGYFGVTNYFRACEEMEEEPSKDYYRGAAVWLKEHSKPESIVFTTDWDDFPYLFFYNTNNYYIVGLDPNYMYKYDKTLYRTWQSITRGKVKHPHKIIVGKFHAYYVLTGNEHEDFIKQANRDGHMKLVYKDKYCRVYSIVL